MSEAMHQMRETVTVALAQIDVRLLEPEHNVRKMVRVASEAATDHGADLVLLPELANTGYITDRDREFGEAYMRLAEPIPGPTTAALGELAAKHQVHIVVGVCEAHPVIPATIFNSAVLIGPSGAVLGVHRKMHMPGQEKHFFGLGDTSDVYQTELGGIGMMICYDAFFPELGRLLALKGAHIICCPFNTAAKHDHPETLVALARTRAIENKLFVATCNRVGTENGVRFFGKSAAADPYGNLLAEAGEEEEIAIATMGAGQLRQERAYHPIFIDRRPELYGPLAKRET